LPEVWLRLTRLVTVPRPCRSLWPAGEREAFRRVTKGSLPFPNDFSALHFDLSAGDGRHAPGIELVLRRMDALMQSFRGVAIQDRDGLLPDDRAGIDPRINKMNGAACDFHPVIKGLFPGFQAGKRRQKRRMDIDDASFEGLQKLSLKDPHEACQYQQINSCLAKRRHVGALGVFFQFCSKFARRQEARGEATLARPFENPCVLDVTQHQGNLRWHLAGRTCIGYRDEIRAFARAEYAESEWSVVGHPVLISVKLVGSQAGNPARAGVAA